MIINIQLSVIIWTVICFFLLVLIVSKLLLKPVLEILDKRRKNLEDARAKEAEYAKLAEYQAKELEQKMAERKLALEAAAKEEVAFIQANEKNDLKQAHTESLENIDSYRRELEKNHSQIVDALSTQMEEVAEIFVKQIISDRT
jgi:F-type H+-transporting ATPase subunit b